MQQFLKTLGVAGLFMIMTGLLSAGEILSSFSDKTLIVAKINVEKVKQVPPIQQALAGQVSNMASFLGQIKLWTGVDLQTTKTFWLGVEKKDYVVIVLEGTFNIDEISDALAAIPNAQLQNKYSVPVAYLLPDDKHPGRQNLAAVLNATTMAFGPPEVAGKFVDNYAGLKADGSKATAAQALSADNQKKIAVLKDSQALLHAVVLGLEPEQAQQQPFLANLQDAELKGDLDMDLVLKLSVGVKKPEMLEPLQKLADGFLGVTKQMDLWSQPQQPPRPDALVKRNLLNNASVAVEGNRVAVHSKIDQAVLNDLISQALKAVPAPKK